MILSFLLVISILAGQLIKFPLVGNLGPTMLDFFIILFCFFGLLKLKFKLKKPVLFIKFGLLFTAVACLSLIVTPLHLSSAESLSSFFYTIRFFLYLLAVWIIQSEAFEQLRQQIPQILTISGVGLVILGLLQFLIFPNLQLLQQFGWDPHYFRTVSTFLDPNFAGAYFVLTLILLASLRAERSNPKQRLLRRLWLLAMTLVYLALLTTFSRSSYLMFLISGLTLSILKKSKSLVFSATILFLILLAGFQRYTQFIAKPRNIDREESASYRFTTWQQGLAIFQQSPLLGVGFNSYRYAIREYNLSDSQFLESRGSTSNDSSLLYILATTGIVGFIIYLFFLGSFIKISNPLLTSGLIGLLVHSLFANSLFYSPILLWLLLIASQPISASPKK